MFIKGIKMIEKIRKLTKQEEGMSLIEMMVSILLFSMLMVAIANPVLSGSKTVVKMAEVDTTVAGYETAVTLRHINAQSAKCVALHDQDDIPVGLINNGSHFKVLKKSDIQDCLNEIVIPSTIKYAVKRSGSNNLCIVGYDTVKDTDKYDVVNPYIYYGPSSIVYPDMPTPCGYSTAKGTPFNWEDMN